MGGVSSSVGYRVVRGPDWKWQNQDNGEGQVGTVVALKQEEKEVVVCWDSGIQANYRAGSQESHDLRVLDSAPLGIKHEGIKCAGCGVEDIKGMRWRCASCTDVNLCTNCYMGDKHNLQHEFLRFTSPTPDGAKIAKRQGQDRIPMNGIFVGARVSRGRHWTWNNQDQPQHDSVTCDKCSEHPLVGVRWKCRECDDYDLCSDCYKALDHDEHSFWKIATPSSTKVEVEDRDPSALLAGHLAELVLRIGGLDPDSDDFPVGTVIEVKVDQPGWVRVKWPHGSTNNYRLGRDGKVDLKYVSCATGGHYYRDSLPQLTFGTDPDSEDEDKIKSDVEEEEEDDTDSDDEDTIAMVGTTDTELKVSDYIQVNIEASLVKELQEGMVGWVPAMAEVIGQTGEIMLLMDPLVMVKYKDREEQLPFCTSVITKVRPAAIGDHVLVFSDEKMVKELQETGGGWVDAMKQILGQRGKVIEVVDSNRIEVRFDEDKWTLNPRACTYVKGQEKVMRAKSPRPGKRESVMNCTICYDNERSVALGCGHTVCGACSEKLTDCPICRKKIVQRINIFF